MSFKSKYDSTIRICNIAFWLKYKSRTIKENQRDQKKIVVFDMRNMVPGRRVSQLSRQFCNIGYKCFFYYPNYLYWIKSFFFQNVNYWDIDISKDNVIVSLPSCIDLLVTKKGTKKLKDTITLFFDNRIMNNITSVRNEVFYYPILMHPYKSTVEFEKACLRFSSDNRSIGILFIGNNDTSYVKNARTMHEKYHVHTRAEVIQGIKKQLKEYVFCPMNYEEFVEAKENDLLSNRIVIIDQFRLSDEYIELLECSRCFICTAGVVMPFCHNHIESIACGCIPIIEFASFYPDMDKVCVSYETIDELTNFCREFCKLNLCNSKEYIEKSRKVKEYYYQYWSIDSFQKKISALQNDQVYYIADNYLK